MVRFVSIGRLDIQVPISQLQWTSIQTAPEVEVEPQPIAEIAPAGGDAMTLQLLEALRLGTVPAAGLELYTVGRGAELAAVDADLERCRTEGGAARVVLGDYGSGKTHLLECIAARAREAGFVVGRTALDPVDVPASNPRRVYRALMRELWHPSPETGRGVMPLLEQAREHEIADLRFRVEARHPYLTPALDVFEDLDLEAAGPLCDWLEGAPQDHTPVINRRYRLYGERALPAMMDYRPWAHIYANLVSGLAALAHAVDHAGLVLLLDEGELFRVLTAENRSFAQRLFRALMAAALPAAMLPFDPVAEPRGGRGAFKSLPCRWSDRAPLYVVLAMTPMGEDDGIVGGLVPESCVTELTTMGIDDYRQLARKVVAVYARCHPQIGPKAEPLSHLVGELIHNGLADGSFNSPRSAVKFVLELFDMARLTPERVRPAIGEIKRLWS